MISTFYSKVQFKSYNTKTVGIEGRKNTSELSSVGLAEGGHPAIGPVRLILVGRQDEVEDEVGGVAGGVGLAPPAGGDIYRAAVARLGPLLLPRPDLHRGQWRELNLNTSESKKSFPRIPHA